MPFNHFDLIAPAFRRVGYSSLKTMRQLAELPVEGRLLDVGGGTGRVSSGLIQDADEIVILDASFGMLKQTDHSALRPVRGDSEFLPFADDSFARLIVVDALHHFMDQPQSAREMLRVLKPGGLIVIQEPDIRSFGVKLMALAEKMLLLHSHFLSAMPITRLFLPAGTKIHFEESSVWVVVGK